MEELYPPEGPRVVRIIILEVSVTSVRVISYSVLDCVIIGDYLSSGKLICNRLPGIKRMLSIPQICRFRRTFSITVFDLLAYVEGLRGLQASDWLILVIRHEYQLLTTQVRIPPKTLGG